MMISSPPSSGKMLSLRRMSEAEPPQTVEPGVVSRVTSPPAAKQSASPVELLVRPFIAAVPVKESVRHGEEVAIPTRPLGLIVIAGTVDVAVRVDVAMYSVLVLLRKVQAFDELVVSTSASWGPVLEAMVRFQ